MWLYFGATIDSLCRNSARLCWAGHCSLGEDQSMVYRRKLVCGGLACIFMLKRWASFDLDSVWYLMYTKLIRAVPIFRKQWIRVSLSIEPGFEPGLSNWKLSHQKRGWFNHNKITQYRSSFPCILVWMDPDEISIASYGCLVVAQISFPTFPHTAEMLLTTQCFLKFRDRPRSWGSANH